MYDLSVEIPRLQAEGLPHADASVFGVLPVGTLHESGKSLEKYAAQFVAGHDPCPCCGGVYWAWTIQHGVAICEDCGWMARVFHYFRKPGESKDTSVQAVLWYHPDELRAR